MRAQPPPCQPKERPQALPIFSATDKAPHSKYLVAAEDYPTFLFMLRFDVPPALLDIPEGFEPVTAVPWFQIFRLDPEPILKANGGAKSFALPAVNAHALIRLIAKISHAYAVAELGLDAFNSVLPRIVRDKDAKGWRRFVGGALNIEPATNRLHEVSLHFHQKVG